MISATDLILSPGNRAYHLNLHPSEIPADLILVGDPERVNQVAKHFDQVHVKHQKREFHTCIGELKGKPIGVISSGIGADNVEILMTELDALVNIDLERREIKAQKQGLNLYRIGTSGSIQDDLPVDSFVISKLGIGLDNLHLFYQFDRPSKQLKAQDVEQLQAVLPPGLSFYSADAHAELLAHFEKNSSYRQEITLTTPGFYAPQGRTLRIKNHFPNYLNRLSELQLSAGRIGNLEMETAAYYAFAAQMGHAFVSFNAILANRMRGEFSKQAEAQVEGLIQSVLNDL